MKLTSRMIGASILGVVVLIGTVVFVKCLEKVPAGYNGVVYSLKGGVTGEILGQGLHVISPFEHVAEYPVSTETMYLSRDSIEGKGDNSFNISTKDGKLVNVDVELSYHYDSESLDDVYTKWRGKRPSEIEDTYIRARVKSIANEITSTYAVMDVYGEKRTELNQRVFDKLGTVLAEDGIILETFNFTRIEPDSKTQEAIQAKVDAQQKLEQDKIEAERVKIDAEKKITAAKAEAEAVMIKAQAEADANKLISQSLTENILELEEIKKWDGKLPTVSGDSTPIINLGGN